MSQENSVTETAVLGLCRARRSWEELAELRPWPRPVGSVDLEPRLWSDDVAAVAAEVDVGGRDLPGALLVVRLGGVVGVDAAGWSVDQPGPVVSEPFGARSLERTLSAASRVDVDIDDVDAGATTGGQADTRVRRALPPVMDDASRVRRVVEAVRCELLLAARGAGEDRDAEVGEADRGTGEGGLGTDALHR